jgi:hypothetical protein
MSLDLNNMATPKKAVKVKDMSAFEEIIVAIRDIQSKTDQMFTVLAGNQTLGQTGLIFKVQSIEKGLDALTKAVTDSDNSKTSEIGALKAQIGAIQAQQAGILIDVAKIKEDEEEQKKEKEGIKGWIKGAAFAVSIALGLGGGILSIYKYLSDQGVVAVSLPVAAKARDTDK